MDATLRHKLMMSHRKIDIVWPLYHEAMTVSSHLMTRVEIHVVLPMLHSWQYCDLEIFSIWYVHVEITRKFAGFAFIVVGLVEHFLQWIGCAGW